MDARTCDYCGKPLPPDVRSNQRYCGRTHKRQARRQAKRREELQARLVTMSHPSGDETLTEKYERAREHRASLDPGEDLREFSDFGDVPGDADELGDDPEDYGIYTTDPADDDTGTAWSDAYRLQAQIEQISDGYRRRAEPYLQQLRRNPGVRPAQLVKLEIEWQQRIDGILAAHERAKGYERAARAEPGRVARAHERQDSIQSMAALSRDLGRGARYQAPAEPSSRATTDVFNFPEQARVFGSDREMYQRSGIARNLGLRVYSTDGWV